MKADLISPGVIHITTDTQYELSSAFMRMQEFYESSNGLKNKFFTYEECMDTYAENTVNGEFSYTTDWAGFNVPSNIVTKFYTLFDHDLLDKERTLRDLITGHVELEDGTHNKKYYVIGTHHCRDASTFIYHEHCHALWYLYPEFKKEAQRIIKRLPIAFKKVLNESLLNEGYDKSVLEDETNAYIATSDMTHIRDYLMCEYSSPTFPWNTIYLLQKHFHDFAEEVMFPENI